MAPKRDQRRVLPSVESLLRHPLLAGLHDRIPRSILLEAVRAEIAHARESLRQKGRVAADEQALAARAAARALVESRPSLRRVLNATGIVLHTNLGRAPLARPAAAALAEVAAGYSSLEFDLATGRRGHRGDGVERWLCRLTGAPAALVVNNGAAAIFLALSALAAGRGVIVSRGELVEIGGSFRVPEILEKSGVRLIEVGTTNRTHLRDYERAFTRHPGVAAVLRVHPSNFQVTGFTARPDLAELAGLARKRRVPIIEDLGSGALVDMTEFGGTHEPTAAQSLASGVDVVTCSGDKLLGGAQAGLIMGRRAAMERIRRDPLARALRADKLALAALEATLPLYADPVLAATEIPVLAMLGISELELRERAVRLAALLAARWPAARTELVRSEGEAGGGSLPGVRLPGWAVALTLPGLTAQQIERRARAADTPVIGTIRAGRFRLDVRTLTEDELAVCARALADAIGTVVPSGTAADEA
ncbi:MAG: L-seryl-tRNA(Sec) selenium transferase [Candidatus Eisenbacteria bacterium]